MAVNDIIRSVQSPVKQQFRTVSTSQPIYTLISLDTYYDQDSGQNFYSATFNDIFAGQFTDPTLTVEQFKRLLGKLGRKFDNQLREVA
jgi:hypothetical protein